MALFTVAEAQAELAALLPLLDEIVAVRANAAELAEALASGRPATAGTADDAASLGGRPELKAAEARLDELMTAVQRTGAHLRGFAPLLLDFPAELDGVDVLLCWLEGERTLQWYHRDGIGFAGRRPLS